MIRSFLLGAFLFILAGAAGADTCVSKEEMREIAQHFQQFQQHAGADYCLDGSETSNLLESLLFMRKTFFQAPMDSSSDELFSGRFKDDWYGYFVQRIDKIEVDTGCPKGVGAYVYGYFDHTMYVCTMLLTKDFTALDRASVFMHEARHIDGFPHTTCHQGPRAGIRGACDSQISDGGSYAVTVETYAQIARYATDLHPALRAYSRAAAVTYADEAFDSPVQVDRTPGIIVLDNDKNFYQLSKTGQREFKTTLLGQAPSLGSITLRAEQLILFPSDRTKTAGYVFPRGEGEIAQQAGEQARLYNELSPQQRTEVLDTFISGQWWAQIKGSKIEFGCDRRSDKTTSVALPADSEALGFIYPDGYSRSADKVLVSFSDGKIYEAGCNGAEQGFINDTGKAYSTPLKRVYKMGSLTVGVDQAGSLYELVNGQPQLIQAPNIHFAYEIAPFESFAFFD